MNNNFTNTNEFDKINQRASNVISNVVQRGQKQRETTSRIIANTVKKNNSGSVTGMNFTDLNTHAFKKSQNIIIENANKQLNAANNNNKPNYSNNISTNSKLVSNNNITVSSKNNNPNNTVKAPENKAENLFKSDTQNSSAKNAIMYEPSSGELINKGFSVVGQSGKKDDAYSNNMSNPIQNDINNKENYSIEDSNKNNTTNIERTKTYKKYEKYKKNNIQEYMEAIENKILSSEIPKEQKRNMVESTVPEPAKLTLYSNETKSKGNSDADKKTEKQSLSQWLDSGEDRWMEKHLKVQKVKERADQVIKDNTEHIINAAKEFGVNPGILAACIYSEHRRNMEFNDYYLDSALAALGKDSSLGVSQVLVSTAKSMEELGYMPKITMNEEGKWGTPDIGYNFDSETQARIKALEDAQTNIMYAAAYLKYIQDVWKEAYPEIDGRTAIMATLYNIGAYGTKGPHSNPQPIDFGNFAKDNYYYVRELMGI